MWWVQPSGDLWILRAHWYGDIVPDNAEAALREWGLAIDAATAADDPYRLGDEPLSRTGFDAAGHKPTRSQVWRHGRLEVTLRALNVSSPPAGLNTLLARGPPTRTHFP